jgi:hypothetical protein
VKVKTAIKSGGLNMNHNETQVRAGGLKVQTSIKAGEWPPTTNHNEAQVRPAGLKVQTSIKAGGVIIQD